MPKYKILLVDDEEAVRFTVRMFLEMEGYDVEEASNCQMAQELFRTLHPDAVLMDYLLPDGNSLDLLPRLKEIDATIPIIILTGHASIDLAVQAIKEGADQFFTKPIELPALEVLLKRVLENKRAKQKQLVGKSKQKREFVDPFIGTSNAINQLAQMAKKVMVSDSPILIKGETGTGKGVLAAWLHNNSSRVEEPFVDLNCAGLSREFLETELFGHEKGAFTGAIASKMGLLEAAHGGTIFLDEIGDVDPLVQPKLLKVLEEKRFRRMGEVRDRRVDVRLIAASHHDLAQKVKERSFRQDLYFRINTLPLMVPSLRDRLEDIPILAEHLLKRLSHDLGRDRFILSNEVIKKLQLYTWPGNIRELRNILERAILLSDSQTLRVQDFHFENTAQNSMNNLLECTLPELETQFDEIEKQRIEQALQEEHNHVEKAAQKLSISRSSLYQKIKKHNIDIK